MSWRSIVFYLHLIPAIFWIGQMIFMTLVLGPISRKNLDPLARAQFYREVGRRSRPWIWGSIVLLILSGLGNLWLMGIPHSALLDASFYQSRFGQTLGWKLLFVFILILLTLLHDVGAMRYGASVRQRLQAQPSDRERAPQNADHHMARYRVFGLWMGRISLLIGLIIAYLGASLMRG